MACRLYLSSAVLSLCFIAFPALSQVTPVSAEVNANGLSASSRNPSAQPISVSGTIANYPGDHDSKSSYGSYLNISDFDSGIYSYTENDVLANSAGKNPTTMSDYGGFLYEFHTSDASKINIDYSFSGNSYFIGNKVTVSEVGGGIVGDFAFNDVPQIASLLLDGDRNYIISSSLNASSGRGTLVANGPGLTKADFTYSVFFTFASAAPEPAAWAMMIIGLSMVGVLLRRRQQKTVNV